MSRSADNEVFARLVQSHMAGTGHYGGAIDGWAGSVTQSAFRAMVGSAEKPDHPRPVEPDPLAGTGRIVLPRETNGAMSALYGQPSSSPTYLDWFSFPIPARLYSRGGQTLDRHRCHRLVAPRLTTALAEILALLGRAEYERQGWHVYGGSHNYRAKRGGSTLSTHAWGIAVDLNPGENGLRTTTTTFSEAAIDVMERHGLLSGGRAWGRDWMHFQAAIPTVSSGSYYARNGLPANIVAA